MIVAVKKPFEAPEFVDIMPNKTELSKIVGGDPIIIMEGVNGVVFANKSRVKGLKIDFQNPFTVIQIGTTVSMKKVNGKYESYNESEIRYLSDY